MKHTQGKWNTENYTDGVFIISDNKRKDCIAEIIKQNNPYKANAKLIAAAPELLEALIIGEKYLHNADRELKSGKTLRQIINQAIKKATQ